MNKRGIAAFLGCAVPVLLCVNCGKNDQTRAANAPPEIPTVAVAKAGVQSLARNLVLTAEFKPFQEIDVMAKVSGYVKKINVDVGDRVKQGQLLATLEIPEMNDDLIKARATVQRSDAEVARAQDEIRRAESTHEMSHLSYQRLSKAAKERPGLIAQQEIDDAQSKDLAAEAQIAAAKSNLAAAVQQTGMSKAEEGRSKTMFDYTRVTAPFSGVITKRYADTGSMIQAGTASQTQAMPLVRLSENSLLRLILPVPESAVSTVRPGQQVEVRVPTLKRSFAGRVARSTDKLQLSTRTMDTEVDVPNQSLLLIPGMYAEVDLTLDRKGDALAIPVSAVDVSNEEGQSAKSGKAMVVNNSGKVEQRTLQLGMETANFVEVLSGLREGELVVIGSRSALQPGQSAKPKLTTMVASQTGN